MTKPDIIITMRFQVEDNGANVPLVREASKVFGEITDNYKVKEAALEIVPASDGDFDARDQFLSRIASAFANDDGRGQSHPEIRAALDEWGGR